MTKLVKVMASLVLGAMAYAATAAEVGQPAPLLSLPDRNGGTRDLAAMRNRVVLVDFWASWCTPCRKSLPWLDGLATELGGRGFSVLAVNLDHDRADAERFLSEVKLAMPVVFDPPGESAKRFGVKAMPSSVLVGPDGKILAIHKGFREDRKAEFEAQIRGAVERLSAGTAPDAGAGKKGG